MSEPQAASSGRIRDRFLFWPLALAIGWSIVMMLATIVPVVGVLMLFPFLGMLCAGFAAMLFLFALVRLKERAWRRALSILIFPALTLVAAFNYRASYDMIRFGGDLIHFGALLPSYRMEIAKLPADRGPRMKYFNWEGWASISFGVLYDESGELEKPVQSAAWKSRAATQLDCEIVGWDPLMWHFYLIELGC